MAKQRIEPFKLSMQAYQIGSESGEGRCIGCRAEAFGVEPDARGLRCESCGQPAVFGLEELLLRNMIEIVE